VSARISAASPPLIEEVGHGNEVEKRGCARARAVGSTDRRRVGTHVQALCEKYGLNRSSFALMLGTTEAELDRLESGTGPAGLTKLARVRQVVAILKKASSTMRLEYVPTWIERPSPACAELGARAPIDLMERGDYGEVEALLYYLGSGVPS
jgi:transcriptional regulator with XRE-family HTH domain